MRRQRLPQQARTIRIAHRTNNAPPRSVEYVYYALLFYGIMGEALGLSISFLGAGMLASLAAFCILRLGDRSLTIYKPLVFPVGCAISFITVQLVCHDGSLMETYTRSFVTWMAALFLVQTLSLRQGFLHRAAPMIFIIGLTTLPFLSFQSGGEGISRAGLDRTAGVGLANPNGLGAWFGFCYVYFLTLGIETKRNGIRIASWCAAIGSLYVVGLTVSRGPLLACAMATIVALRHLLKRSFLPLFCLMLLGWIIYVSGVFEEAIGQYSARGTEETGRFVIWPIALQHFLDSPLIGVGISNIYIASLGSLRLITPHNSFLFIALASGIMPLAFFLGYWIRVAQGALRAHAERLVDAPFQLVLLLYAFLIAHILNQPFMEPWMVVTLAMSLGVDVPRRARQVVVRRVKRGVMAEHLSRYGETRSVAEYRS